MVSFTQSTDKGHTITSKEVTSKTVLKPRQL